MQQNNEEKTKIMSMTMKQEEELRVVETKAMRLTMGPVTFNEIEQEIQENVVKRPSSGW